jgi:hypothetical protein
MYVTHRLIPPLGTPAAQIALQRLECCALGVMAIDRPQDGFLGAGKCLAGTSTNLFGLSNSVTSGKNSVKSVR